MNTFKEWLKTVNGKLCNDFSTLRGQPYLENRLYHAYSAGMIDEHNLKSEQLKQQESTLQWYEQKKRESDKLIKELHATIESLKEKQPNQLSESERP